MYGCAGGIEDPDQFPPPECAIRGFDIFEDLLVPRCGTANCHVGPAPAADLDLVSPGIATRVLDTASTGCGRRLLVNTSSPAESVLLEKIRPAPICGQTMPLGGPPLTLTESACLTEWVRQVAASAPR